MTIKELIDLLTQFNPDYQVIMSKDAEANGFSPLDGLNLAKYVPYSSYSGWLDEVEKTSEYNAVVFYPTN